MYLVSCFEEYEDKWQVQQLEYAIKRLPRKENERLIENGKTTRTA
jgi:predicted GIY-YIG superfamily endonuclease